MTGNKLFITGATGFIGSHITRHFHSRGFKILAFKRPSSSLSRCMDYADNIQWINGNWDEMAEQVLAFRPDLFIHAGWEGIQEPDRNNWSLQLSNFNFSMRMIDVAIQSGAEKIIALGSQSEYGDVAFRSSEDLLPAPTDAYGTMKLLTQHYLRIYAIRSGTQWYWLRIYSIFGPSQYPEAILPVVIRHLLPGFPVELTSGEQRYDYLYIDDFLGALDRVVEDTTNRSGVYNIGTGQSIRIKDLLTKVASVMNADPELLRFGTIPYRSSQPMLIECNPARFEKEFGKIPITLLDKALEETVRYFKTSKNKI